MKVGHALCTRTGLPFNDLERDAEARAGRGRSRVLLLAGLREAQVILEAGDRHPAVLADELADSLDRLVGAEPL